MYLLRGSQAEYPRPHPHPPPKPGATWLQAECDQAWPCLCCGVGPVSSGPGGITWCWGLLGVVLLHQVALPGPLAPGFSVPL